MLFNCLTASPYFEEILTIFEQLVAVDLLNLFDCIALTMELSCVDNSPRELMIEFTPE